ncbi:MAG: 16S rRNA (cytosine(1402)-N(4))-methyltransferase RsmH [Dehalococcoidia bacterium]|nr:16S rRNA (cytosine(1402)-N(4))-methyltransferase RsmH [Dehalococcoidia bacterium]
MNTLTRLTNPTSNHIPVMLNEAIEGLNVQRGGRYVDCTLGGGGHAASILEESSPGGQLLGIDADPAAISAARERLREYRRDLILVNDNFKKVERICTAYGFRPVHGILFDLGMSSLQLEDSSRGFSFQRDAPLDMRFSPDQKLTAADVVNTFSERELADLIFQYGEEPRSRVIARHIVRKRPVVSTLQLAKIIERAVGERGRIHPATRTFQALRIAVNEELDNLKLALEQSVNLLGFGGRLVVISFHSLEDRVVKVFMQQQARGCICPPDIPECVCGRAPTLRVITRKPVTPGEAEVEANPRSRSAKMRVAERV